MIEVMELTNFEGHEHSVIQFVPGLNVVSGSSDAGKSALIRALCWACFNRPSGLGFRSHFVGKEDEVSVGVQFNNGHFVRTRCEKGNSNTYEDRGGTYAALRTDVPESISNLVNMTDLNVQRQFDAYFLLQTSPGDVARLLNSYVNLNIIDLSVKKVNGIVKQANWDAERLENEIIEETEDLKRYDELDDLKEKLDEINNLDQKITAMKFKLDGLLRAVFQIRSNTELLEKWKHLDRVEKTFQKAEAINAKAEDLKDDLFGMRPLILSLRESQARKKELEEIISAEGPVTALLSEIFKAGQIEKKIRDLTDIMSGIVHNSKLIKKHEAQIAGLKAEYAELLQQEGICPTCGADCFHHSPEKLL